MRRVIGDVRERDRSQDSGVSLAQANLPGRLRDHEDHLDDHGRPGHQALASREAVSRSLAFKTVKSAWSDDEYTLSWKQRVELLAEKKLGALSSDAQALSRRMESGELDPFAYAETYLQNSHVELETIRVVLHRAREQMFKLPRWQRIEAYASKNFKLASAVLLKIWKDPYMWLPLVLGDHHATWSLTWFAQAENVDHLLLEWVKADLGQLRLSDAWPQVTNSKRATFGSHWRGDIFQKILEMKFVTNGMYSADTAFADFKHIFEWREGLVKSNSKSAYLSDVKHMPLGFSAHRMVSALCIGGSYRSSSVLWDQFAAMRQTIVKPWTSVWHLEGIEQLEFDLARLDLFHPTKPTAEKFLAILNEMHSNQGNDLSIPEVKIRHAIQVTMQRAWVVHKGHQQDIDAEWIVKAYEATFKKRFQVESRLFLVLPSGMRKLASPHADGAMKSTMKKG